MNHQNEMHREGLTLRVLWCHKGELYFTVPAVEQIALNHPAHTHCFQGSGGGS